MPSKGSSNIKSVQKELEKKISPVLVINNSTLKPYVELFNYAPENIYQQPLGSLIGFFEVKEYSEDSAYIVNFLTSVLKKEYYINPKRPVGESLDSALHKVNVALSELAKHGNVQWLGNLHAAICVLEKNNTHFSVSGDAKIFLFRGQALTEISEDLASDTSEPHPLKTFVNVSSGALEKNDRLLITSGDIFHILSYNDLKKNFQRFEGEKFVQLLKTALSNQMEMIASVVVGIHEPEKIVKAKKNHKKSPISTENVFSEKTFTPLAAATAAATVEEALSNTADAATEILDNEYRDEKTGHIYIQGEPDEAVEISKTQLFFENTKEKLGEVWYLTKNEIRRRHFLYKKHLAKKLETWKAERVERAQLRAEQARILEEERLKFEQELAEQQQREAELAAEQQQYEAALAAEQQQIQAKLATEQQLQVTQTAHEQQDLSSTTSEQLATINTIEHLEAAKSPIEQPQEKHLSFQEKLRLAMEETAIQNSPQPEQPEKELSFQEKLQIAKQQRSAVIDLRPKTNTPEPPQATETVQADMQPEEEIEPTLPVKVNLIQPQPKYTQIKNWLQKNSQKCVKIGKNLFFTAQQKAAQYFQKRQQEKELPANVQQKTKHLTPRFSKIKKSFGVFTFKQKIYTFLGLILVFVVPLFIARWTSRPKPHAITELQTQQQNSINNLATEKNSNPAAAKSSSVLTRSDLVDILVTSAGSLAVTKNSILMLSNGQAKEYPLPSNEGSAVHATFMSDLTMVLVLTDQNKVISFSPTTFKFTDNSINFTANAANSFIGTYMTYLYVLDPSANQIYRYPRADGGFADKTNWYKDTASLSNVSTMTIDDSIYCVQNNQVLKLFKGKTQQLNLATSDAPIKIAKIFTSLDANYLWVLDTQNSRIISYDKTSGSIINKYQIDSVKAATSFAVDEKNKIAYIITSNGLTSIELQ